MYVYDWLNGGLKERRPLMPNSDVPSLKIPKELRTTVLPGSR